MKKEIVSNKLALSVAEMAEALGVSRTTAYELVNREGFPSAHLGQRIVVPVDALKRWLERGGTDAANM